MRHRVDKCLRVAKNTLVNLMYPELAGKLELFGNVNGLLSFNMIAIARRIDHPHSRGQ